MGNIASEIQNFKKSRKAIILAHNYQLPEVQEIADYVGDSLGLTIQASKTNAETVVFCGVHFMAEMAAILCPDKLILMPDDTAGCPMANMITVDGLRKIKAEHPKAKVVAYVNTSAEVKAESDICCTSANAGKVIESLPDKEIIFVPDKYLGGYWQTQLPNKKLILWPGYCPIHMFITSQGIKELKMKYPKAEVMVHPECTPEVIAEADKVLSTDGMVKWAKESSAAEFIVGTEVGIIHRLKKENPNKEFYPASERAICPNMKKTTLEKVLWSLEELRPAITVPKSTAVKARQAIDRMLNQIDEPSKTLKFSPNASDK